MKQGVEKGVQSVKKNTLIAGTLTGNPNLIVSFQFLYGENAF
jgi:hypothetical protein